MNIDLQSMLGCLPFSEDPLAEWDEQSDIFKFIFATLDTSDLFINEDGTSKLTNYNNLTPNYFDEGKEKILNWINLFAKCADKDLAVLENSRVHFSNSPIFGKAAKYFIAWERVISNSLEESAFFSIAHVLESEHDVSSSFLLSANLYYKQAMQVLRTYLENQILPLYFCDNPKEFDKWKKNEFRTPSIRGEKGILRKLANKHIISESLANEVSNIYEELNNYIHGSERSLISKGVFTGDYLGFVYKQQDFLNWCNHVSLSIHVGIQLHLINLSQWEASSGSVLKCNICHKSDFTIDELFWGNNKSYLYRCSHCGNEMRRSSKTDT